MSEPFTVSKGEAGQDILSFLARRASLSRKKAKALLDSRNVLVNRRRVWMARHSLAAGDIVTLSAGADPTPDVSIPRLFEDKEYLVVNKPPGILSDDRHSVESILRERLGLPSLRAVHRLDRDTSGCLWLARHSEALDRAVELFRRRQVMKLYHAVVLGRLRPPEQTVTLPIEGMPTVTRLRTLDSSRTASHIALRIETGRTHQIRRHLCSLGHPVLGDKSYGFTSRDLPVEHVPPRQMLHASVIEFTHPLTNRRIRAEAPLPNDFRRCLARFGLT